MDGMTDNSYKTAIKRGKPSLPYQKYKYLLYGRILDYGCGYGEDVSILKSEGYDIEGFDPHLRWVKVEGQFDIVTCNYVINVIRPSQYDFLLNNIKIFMKDDAKLLISTRHKSEEKSLKNPVKDGDGWVTQKGTYQRFFTITELESVILKHFLNVKLINKNPIILQCERKI